MVKILEALIAALFVSCSPPQENYEPLPAAPNENPMIQFDPGLSRNIRVGTEKEFRAFASDSNNTGEFDVRCRWDFGDGTTATLATTCKKLSHTYNQPGTYTVKITAMDPSGGKTTVSDVFTAYLNIPPHVDAGKDVSITPVYYFFAFGAPSPQDECQDEPEEFFAPHHTRSEHPESTDEDGNIPDDEFRYGFLFDSHYRAYPYCRKDGTNCGGYVIGKCPYIEYTKPGNYKLVLEVTDNEGATSTDEINVNVVNE